MKDFISRFGFHATPFTCEIRVEDHFIHDVYSQPIQHLYRAVENRMCAALVAPSGTGKTSVLRALVAQLPEIRYSIHYVKVTDLSKRDLCREISTAVGTEPAGNYPALVRRLQQRFANNFDIDCQRPVLILDEAHEMRIDVLGIIRILTNFEMDSRLVVSIILAGQANLSKLLKHPKLEDIAHRMGHYATLRLLSREEIIQYIKHRCTISGVSSAPFDKGAMEAIYEMGRGNLRATDHLVLKSLQAAHDAQCDIVDANHITEARRMLWA